jgi:hypothetical protein
MSPRVLIIRTVRTIEPTAERPWPNLAADSTQNGILTMTTVTPRTRNSFMVASVVPRPG